VLDTKLELDFRVEEEPVAREEDPDLETDAAVLPELPEGFTETDAALETVEAETLVDEPETDPEDFEERPTVPDALGLVDEEPKEAEALDLVLIETDPDFDTLPLAEGITDFDETIPEEKALDDARLDAPELVRLLTLLDRLPDEAGLLELPTDRDALPTLLTTALDFEDPEPEMVDLDAGLEEEPGTLETTLLSLDEAWAEDDRELPVPDGFPLAGTEAALDPVETMAEDDRELPVPDGFPLPDTGEDADPLLVPDADAAEEAELSFPVETGALLLADAEGLLDTADDLEAETEPETADEAADLVLDEPEPTRDDDAAGFDEDTADDRELTLPVETEPLALTVDLVDTEAVPEMIVDVFALGTTDEPELTFAVDAETLPLTDVLLETEAVPEMIEDADDAFALETIDEPLPTRLEEDFELKPLDEPDPTREEEAIDLDEVSDALPTDEPLLIPEADDTSEEAEVVLALETGLLAAELFDDTIPLEAPLTAELFDDTIPLDAALAELLLDEPRPLDTALVLRLDGTETGELTAELRVDVLMVAGEDTAEEATED